jgi:hypothetical protein
MRLTVDIGEFSPDEIVVKTTDRKLIVHAEHEERSAGRTLHKEFNKVLAFCRKPTFLLSTLSRGNNKYGSKCSFLLRHVKAC